MALSASWTHGLIAHWVIASGRNLVVLDSNPTQFNFIKLLQRILQWWITLTQTHRHTYTHTYIYVCIYTYIYIERERERERESCRYIFIVFFSHHFISLLLNSFDFSVDKEDWWFGDILSMLLVWLSVGDAKKQDGWGIYIYIYIYIWIYITGRAHCFHDCVCFSEIWALCVSWMTYDHLWHIYLYLYLYLYI